MQPTKPNPSTWGIHWYMKTGAMKTGAGSGKVMIEPRASVIEIGDKRTTAIVICYIFAHRLKGPVVFDEGWSLPLFGVYDSAEIIGSIGKFNKST